MQLTAIDYDTPPNADVRYDPVYVPEDNNNRKIHIHECINDNMCLSTYKVLTQVLIIV